MLVFLFILLLIFPLKLFRYLYRSVHSRSAAWKILLRAAELISQIILGDRRNSIVRETNYVFAMLGNN